jgi:radical SAM protein with 4Fe4S-binding SPASM domain
MFKSVDYTGFIDTVKDQYTGQPIDLDDDRPCPQVFTLSFILPTGDVVPCCVTPNPVTYGNITETALADIWNSPERAAFIELHEHRRRSQNPVCRRCVEPPIQNGP